VYYRIDEFGEFANVVIVDAMNHLKWKKKILKNISLTKVRKILLVDLIDYGKI
jgi:hypothetical protein